MSAPRRALLGALPVALAFPSLAAAPTSQDADLLAAVVRFHACEARQVEVDALYDPSDELMAATYRAWNTARGEVEALTPVTLEGFRAKAGVLVVTLSRDVGYSVDIPFEEMAEGHERLAMRFARDVLAMAGGVA